MITKVVSGMATMFAADAVEARPVEMEQRHRHQRDLDARPVATIPSSARPSRAKDPFVAALEQPPRPSGRMEGDDRGDGGEAHLEARAGQRFRTKDEHDQRAGRDQADADRVAPERDPGEDQQGGDAAADRRHLRAGQQRVADAGGRSDAGGDEHEVEAERQPLAQGEQLEGQQHREGDDCGDVKPLTDSRCVSPLRRIASASLLIHRILVAGREGDRDSRANLPAGAAR